MARYRILATVIIFLGLLAFIPKDAQSRQTFDATLRFSPDPGTLWHYLNYTLLLGDEIEMGRRSRVGGLILTVYDETVNSSGEGLVGMHLRYNIYEALDLGYVSEYENPSGPFDSPDYSAGPPSEDMGDRPPVLMPGDHGEPLQSAGGGSGGAGGGDGGGGSGSLAGEGEFDLVPIMETDINYILSESGRLLDIGGLDLIGEITDPSRSLSVRQIFETSHFAVLPDYEVHLNESWRAPMSWTIPFVGETMEIPLTYTLSDIRTTFRFRVAAIDFHGILQFDVDVAAEGQLADERGDLYDVRKESNIKGDIIIQGRLYVDIDRGVVVAICDTPALGNTYFLDGDKRGNETDYRGYNDLGLPWPLNPGFYASLNFERRDLYTPLGNVIDPRQEIQYKIQEMQWFTTTVVE